MSRAATETRGWVELDAIEGEEAKLAGGKAARLAELKRHGFQVPDGFVLTTKVFGDSHAAAAAVAEALPRLGTATRVAVRSSAVAEDLEEASFAGQYATVLGVSGAADVLAAVDNCWASAGAARVAEYSRRRSGGQAGPMAVLVQRLVDADAAGVAYSANPVTGDRDETVISAVRGLGDRLVAGEAAPDEWTVLRHRAVCTRTSEGAIDASQANRIAQLARGVADRLGGPQDIEWVLTGNDLFLLQARPITALPEMVEWKSPAPGVFARNFRLGEWLGDPITPLFETWLLERMEVSFWEQMRRFGPGARPPYHVVVNGWYFYSMNLAPERRVDMLRMLVGLIPKLFSHGRRALAGHPPFWRLAGQFLPIFIKDWEEVARPRHQEAVQMAAAAVETASVEELIALIDLLADDAGVYFFSVISVTGWSAKAEAPLQRLYQRWVEPIAGGSYLDLLQGLYRPQPHAGGHAVVSLDWYQPTLGELRMEVEPPEAVQRRQLRLAAARERAASAARAALGPHPQVLAEFEKTLGMAQRLQPLREEQALDFTLGWPVMRRALARLGADLVAHEVIDEPHEIYFLKREEAMRGTGRLGATARSRREAWERQRRLTPPLRLGAYSPRSQGMANKIVEEWTPRPGRSSNPDALTGIAASGGRATGPARIVRGIHDFDRLQPGDVLVAPATTPAWTPLFTRAAAVVTDTGSVSAHASQVAREYGIPAVVCTGDAMRRLADGRLVTVDGSAGVVTPAGEEGRR